MDFIADECCTNVSSATVKVGHAKSCVYFVNPDGVELIRVLFDGCVDKSGKSADYLLSDESRVIVIELKGTDIEGAVLQVHETAAWLREAGFAGALCGLIVGRDCPKERSTLQVRRLRFSREFRAPLHVVQPLSRLKFENVFQYTNFRKLS